MKKNPSIADLQDVKKRSVNGAISYFIRTIILQVIGIVSVFVLSAYFKPEDFGIYGFVLQIIGLLIFFSDVGLAAALVQKKDEPTSEDYKTTFTVQQILAWVIVLICIAVSQLPFISQKMGMDGFWILLSLAISFPLATLKTIPSVILERKLLFSKLIIPQIFEQFVFHGLLIILAVLQFGVIAYAYAIVARSIVGVVVMYFLQKWPVGIAINKTSLGELLGFGFRFQLNDFLARIKDQLFYLVIGLALPLREFGYVQWAKNWSMYPYNLTVQNVMAVTFPTFARLQHDKKNLQKAIEVSLFFITLTIFPILVVICVFILPFIQLFPVYQKWLPAVASLIFFTLSIAWSAIASPLTNTLSAIGQINESLRLMIMWTTLTWLLTPIAIVLFGFNGIALAAFVISFSSILSIIFVKKHVSFNFSDQVWRQLVGSTVMAVAGVLGIHIWSESIILFIAGMIIVFSTYILTMYFLGKQKLKQSIALLGLKIPFNV